MSIDHTNVECLKCGCWRWGYIGEECRSEGCDGIMCKKVALSSKERYNAADVAQALIYVDEGRKSPSGDHEVNVYWLVALANEIELLREQRDTNLAKEVKEIQRLRTALKDLIRGYLSSLEAARERILFHGGTCDPVDMMERGDPCLIKAKAALNCEHGQVETSGVHQAKYGHFWTVEELHDGHWSRSAVGHAWALETDARSQCEELRRIHGARIFRVSEYGAQQSETSGVRPCSCADGARYRFLREPNNAIVYAKDRDAWGTNASGHVRYDTPEQLDAAVDAARFQVKAKGDQT